MDSTIVEYRKTGAVSNILSVRKIPPHDKRYLLLIQLLQRNLKGVRLALKIDQDWRIHTNLQGPRTQDPGALVLGHVGCSCALFVRNPFLALLEHGFVLGRQGVRVAARRAGSSRTASTVDGLVRGLSISIDNDGLASFDEIFGLVVIKCKLGRLVVEPETTIFQSVLSITEQRRCLSSSIQAMIRSGPTLPRGLRYHRRRSLTFCFHQNTQSRGEDKLRHVALFRICEQVCV